MNQVTRDAILRGACGAEVVHDALRLRERHQVGLSAIDVFGVFEELQIPVNFQDLGDLLGSFVRVAYTKVGILVTSKQDLHLQRFTAAHELGHFILWHDQSLDREVGPPGRNEGRDPMEVEADAFAAELLLPNWLVKATAMRRDWWGETALRSPEIVYQISLRLATSYEAMCWGLAAHEFIDGITARALAQETLKGVKRLLLKGDELRDWPGDVWKLGASDDGAKLYAGPKDVFIVELEERASTGFRLDPSEAIELGFKLIGDESTFDPSIVGGVSQRRLVFTAPPPGTYELRLPRVRSFSRSGSESTVWRLTISTGGTRRVGNLSPIAPLTVY